MAPTPATIRRRTAGLLALGLAAPWTARAAADWPARPVRIVIPYAPGGGADAIARTIFGRLTETLGQNFVVENRGGGGGTIGAALVAAAPPDGSTFLHDATALSVNETLYRGRLPFDARRDLRPVFLAGLLPNLLCANPRLPQRSVADVIALAKATPGGLDWGSGGNGGVTHLLIEMLAAQAGIRLNHIPYRGGAQCLTAVIAGEVPFAFSNTGTASGQVRSGLVRALAHSGTRPPAALPDLPAVGATLPGFEGYEWNAVFAPAGTPEEIVQRLNRHLNDAVRNPDVQARLAGISVETRANTPAAAAEFFAAEVVRWGEVVRAAGIQPG